MKASPNAPEGYRLLKEGDTNSTEDFVWMLAPDDWVYEWVPANNPFHSNPRYQYGNGKLFTPPYTDRFSEWRCRKVEQL
jgi:hypothetical protein